MNKFSREEESNEYRLKKAFLRKKKEMSEYKKLDVNELTTTNLLILNTFSLNY